jgi:hypothetical protein
MMSSFSFISLNFLPVSCLPFSNYYKETYLWSALPLLFALTIVLYSAVSAAFVLEGTISVEKPNQLRHLFNRCISYLLLMSYLVLPPISLKQYQGLNCQSIRGGKSFLRIDTSIDCDSNAYHQFRSINGLCIAVYSAIPPMWLYFLWKQRHRLNPPTSDLRLAYHLRDSDKQLAYLSFLFAPYQPRFFYFEAVEM